MTNDYPEPTPEEVMEVLRRWNRICGWVFAFFISCALWYFISWGIAKVIMY